MPYRNSASQFKPNRIIRDKSNCSNTLLTLLVLSYRSSRDTTPSIWKERTELPPPRANFEPPKLLKLDGKNRKDGETGINGKWNLPAELCFRIRAPEPSDACHVEPRKGMVPMIVPMGPRTKGLLSMPSSGVWRLCGKSLVACKMPKTRRWPSSEQTYPPFYSLYDFSEARRKGCYGTMSCSGWCSRDQRKGWEHGITVLQSLSAIEA